MRLLLIIFCGMLLNSNFALSQSDSLGLKKTILNNYYYVNHHIVKKKEFKTVLKTKPEALKKYRAGSLQIGTGTFLLCGGIILSASIDTKNPNNKPYWWQWAGGIGGVTSGIILNITGVKTQLASVQLFNRTPLILSTNYTGLQLNLKL